MTTDLVVLVPTRGRPRAAVELSQAFKDTCTARTKLVFVLDDDDPRCAEYTSNQLCMRTPASCMIGEHRSMVEALNDGADFILQDAPFAVGFMGDDHRPRTPGWDQRVLSVLRELGTGIVYCNDLFQKKNLPTQVFMTGDIPAALGYMALPALRHLYLDNWWKTLGEQAGCLSYLGDTVIEHMHPFAGKGQIDEGYKRANSAQVETADKHTYELWLDSANRDREITSIKELLAVKPTVGVQS